jgi:hypothetical protein
MYIKYTPILDIYKYFFQLELTHFQNKDVIDRKGPLKWKQATASRYFCSFSYVCYEERRDEVAYLNHCQGSALFTYTPLRIAQGYAARWSVLQETLVWMINLRRDPSCKFILHSLHSWSLTSLTSIASFLFSLLPFVIEYFPLLFFLHHSFDLRLFRFILFFKFFHSFVLIPSLSFASCSVLSFISALPAFIFPLCAVA